MIHAFLLSCAVIFVAELGDKSQLMALAFATRYRALPVLIGISSATAFVHAISVGIGAGLGAALPVRPMAIIAGVAFLAFAVWTLRGDELTAKERERADKSARNAIVAASIAFFLAELGDKTMLATITLATRENLLGTWAGSTIGMVVADALAIIVGQQLGKRFPERAVRIGAATSFVIFGALLIADGVRG